MKLFRFALLLLLLGSLPVLTSCSWLTKIQRTGIPHLPEKVGFDAFPGPKLIVNTKYVMDHYDKPNVALIDVRTREAYDTGHLPGAISVPAHVWRTGKPMYSLYHVDSDQRKPYSVTRYEKMLGYRGISQIDEVIIYGDPEDYQTLIPVFILDWLGHRKLHYVDGNVLEEWIELGGMPTLKSGFRDATTYNANNVRTQALWYKEDVARALKNDDVILWDCRTDGEFKGKVAVQNVKRAGHIPSARHIYFEELYRDPDKYQTRFYSELKIMLAKPNINMDPEKQIVIYSHDGSRAAYCYLVLRMMGYERVAIYEHSWLEWGNDDLLRWNKPYQDDPLKTVSIPRAKKDTRYLNQDARNQKRPDRRKGPAPDRDFYTPR